MRNNFYSNCNWCQLASIQHMDNACKKLSRNMGVSCSYRKLQGIIYDQYLVNMTFDRYCCRNKIGACHK